MKRVLDTIRAGTLHDVGATLAYAAFVGGLIYAPWIVHAVRL